MKDKYIEFLQKKIVVAESYGFTPEKPIGNILPHAVPITQWCIEGGRRAIFASFGLTKTAMQIEIAYQVIKKTDKPFLIVMPLGVVGEFKRDNQSYFESNLEMEYITDSDSIENYSPKIYLTNYERIRKGDIDASKFGGVSFDEASILRNLKTETTNYVLSHFKKVPYRFVATATPTPNDFIEILNYADYLGVIDRGHALTRFFQRDSTHAGRLTLYENKKEEFWKWVSTWAVFINKPSDLGFDDTGYDLPKMHLHEVEVYNPEDGPVVNKKGDLVLFKDLTKSLPDVSKEKSESVQLRVDKAFEIVSENPDEKWILWHHREVERIMIEKKFKDFNLKSVYGSQPNQVKEDLLIDFSNGEYQILSSKPVIAGSGCNFQHSCHNMVFVGLDYKFNDFLQAIHRVFRFRQAKEVNVYVIFTNNEYEVLKTLKTKWKNHIELQSEMINIVREYGLNSDKVKADMKRQLFSKRREAQVGAAKVYNEDTTIIHQEMPDNYTDMIITSIPFGDHYEYSDNYNDFGHNHGNDEFFKQMNFLTPHLLRTLKPGRIAAIHVKDRIRYSYQNGTSFTTISDFSGQTVAHFTKERVKHRILDIQDQIKELEKYTRGINDFEEIKKDNRKHVSLSKFKKASGEIKKLKTKLQELQSDYENRFHLVGKITVTTDVVRENNQTYRLTWGEQMKDGTKMGVGLPEYILLFRKPPSESNNAYADEPVTKQRGHSVFKCGCCGHTSTDEQGFKAEESELIKAVGWERYDCGEVDSKCPSCGSFIKLISFRTMDEYGLPMWQLDAHAYWKSSGNRFLSGDELAKFDMKRVYNAWKKYDKENIYNFQEHLRVCEDLDKSGRLSKLFMTIPPTSSNELVWTDIKRMNTLNANQVNRKKEKHICLAKGTLILTQRGYIPIEDVIVNKDETLTHLGRWRKIIAKKMTQQNAEIVQVRAQGVPNLKVTPTHKIWSRRHKGYRPSETFQQNQPDWHEAQKLKSHYVNQKLAPVIESDMSNTDCWIIGRWLADGHVDFRGHQYFISVGKDKIPEFKNICSEFIGAANDKGSSVQYGMKNLSKDVRDILSKCGKGAENKVLPIELISLDVEKSKHLLQGYMSGDGHIDKSGNWHFSSVSRALLLVFSLVIQKAYGFIPSVYAGKKAGKHIIEGREVNAKECWVLAVKTSGHHTFGKILEDGAWKKVRDVVEAGKTDVWNISVEEDASYTAEGCIVKNCPLQLDIIERLINRFTNKGDLIDDPFGGLFSTAYKSLEMKRRAISTELNPEYYNDGLFYLKAMEYKINVPTLFDLEEA